MSHNGNLLSYTSIPDRIISDTEVFSGAYSGHFLGGNGYGDPAYFSNTVPSQVAPTWYLSTPYTSDFDLSSGDFTISADIFVNAFDNIPASGMCVVVKDRYGFNWDWSIIIKSSTNIQFWTAASVVKIIATVPTMNTGQWYNVKVEKIGATTGIYLDNTLYASANISITNSSQNYITVGCSSWNNPGGFFNGYLDNVRIIKGVTDSMFLEFESINTDKETFTDNTGKIFTINPAIPPNLILNTNSSPSRIIVDTEFYSGSKSGLFSSLLGSFIRTAYKPEFDLSTGDISVEARFKLNSVPVGGGIIFTKDTYGSSFDFCLYVVDNQTLAMYTAATSQSIIVTVPALNMGQWYHIKFERVSGINYYYLDGVDYISPSGVNTLPITNDSQLWLSIGCAGGGTNPNTWFDGYIDDFKITKNGIDVSVVDFEAYKDATKKEIIDNIDGWWTIEPPSDKVDLYNPIHIDIVRDNLVLHLDTVDANCYPRTGTNIYNLVNISEVGTLENGALFNSITGEISLDGTNDYIKFDNAGISTFNPHGLSNYSFSTWFKNDNDTGGLISWYRTPEDGENGFELELASGVLYFAFTSSEYCTYPYPNTGEWVNFGIVYDGTLSGNSNKLKVFINGIKVNPTYVGTIPNTINANTETLDIGLIQTTLGDRFINGGFGHLLTYTSALSDLQILQNYNATKNNYL